MHKIAFTRKSVLLAVLGLFSPKIIACEQLGTPGGRSLFEVFAAQGGTKHQLPGPKFRPDYQGQIGVFLGRMACKKLLDWNHGNPKVAYFCSAADSDPFAPYPQLPPGPVDSDKPIIPGSDDDDCEGPGGIIGGGTSTVSTFDEASFIQTEGVERWLELPNSGTSLIGSSIML